MESKGGISVSINPASKPFSEVKEDLAVKDYGEIVNSCMRHTKCREGRCLTKKVGGQLVCRFGFPREKRETTFCEKLPQGKGMTLATQRNDPLIVSSSPQMTVAWRANCESQMIVTVEALLRYLLKYLNKAEPMSDALHRIQENVATDSFGRRLSSKSVIQSVLITTVGNRDFSLQESAHHLLSLPLFFCSRSFQVLHTSGLREINNEGTLPCYLDAYKDRPSEQEGVCLFQFVKKFNNGKQRRKEVVVQVKPRHRRILQDDRQNELWFQQQIILFVPWRGNTENLKANHETWRETFESLEKDIDQSRVKCGLQLSSLENELPEEENVLVVDVEDEKKSEVTTETVETDPYHLATHKVPLHDLHSANSMSVLLTNRIYSLFFHIPFPYFRSLFP